MTWEWARASDAFRDERQHGYDAVAIPSSNRVKLFGETTLPLLLERGVPADKVTVFVPDEAQEEAYRKAHEHAGINFTSGHGRGVRQARNAIARAYPKGTRLVCIDDDVWEIYRTPDSVERVPILDLEGFWGEAFARSLRCLWGVYPVDNPYFQKPGLIRYGGLWYIEGSMFGWTVRGGEPELVEADDKEDFERSIRFYLRDGQVVRFEDVAFRTNYYTNPGGMQDYRTADTIDGGARFLAERYPELTRLHRPSSGHLEVRLRDKRASNGRKGRRS